MESLDSENKRTKNHKKIYDHMTYIIIIFIFLFEITLNNPIYKNKDNYYSIKSHAYEITIKIRGTGLQNIIASDYYLCPYSVYLGDELINTISGDCHVVDIPQEKGEINTLKISWNLIAVSLYNMFHELTNITEVDLTNYDTSSITDMHEMFNNCSSITSINLSNLNTSIVNNMRLMFGGCSSLTSLNVSSFDTSNVILLDAIFSNMDNIEHLYFNFNTEKVTNMSMMFYRCEKLTSLDVSMFNTISVTNMDFMFSHCFKLQSLDVRHFNTSNVVYMNHMFQACSEITSLDLSNFQTSKVVNMDRMFLLCSQMTSLNVSNFDTSQVTNMNYMFYSCGQLSSLDLSNFKTPNLKTMEVMFYLCQNLSSLDISNFNTSQITDMHMIFQLCRSLTTLDLSSFDTSNVDNMEYLFGVCDSLTTLNLSNFDTHNVKKMKGLFMNCTKLESVDLSSFNVSLVEDLTHMFAYCHSLTYLNLSNFCPSNSKSMHMMFYYCYNLRYLDLSNFDTSSPEDMSLMFSYCENLNSLDVSSFNTVKVTKFNYMFYDCINLKELDLSNFDTSSLTDASFMFYNDFNLEYINLQNYNEVNNLLLVTSILDYMLYNIVVCLNVNNQLTKFIDELRKKLCPINYCGGDWKSKQLHLIYGTSTCVANCLGYKYEFNGLCFTNCPEGAIFCTPEIENSDSDITNTIITVNDKSTNINSLSHTIDNIPVTPSSNINVILDKSSQITYKIEENNISQENLIINSDTSLHSISDTLNNKLSEISSNIISSNIKDDISNNIPNIDERLNNEEIYQDVKNNIIQNYTGSEGKEVFIEGNDDFLYHITTTKNENNLLNLNNDNNENNRKISKIDLGYCENILKEYYHIDNNESLIIIKYEKITNISKEKVLQYEVYEPYNKTKLNLSLCDNTTISIYVPIVLSDELQKVYNQLIEKGYDIFDINGAFYQDICVPFTTPYGTDVLLSDRISYYYHNNEIICQSNCKPANYSMESQYLKCDCDTANSQIITREIDKLNAKTVSQIFYDTLKFSNYKVLFCYKLPFRINSITTNIGSILTIVYFLIYFVFLIIYCCKGIIEFKMDLGSSVLKSQKSKKDDDIENDDDDDVDTKKQTSDNLDDSPQKNKKKKKKKSQYLSSKKLIKKKLKKIEKDFPPKKNASSVKEKKPKKKAGTKNRQTLSEKNVFLSNKLLTINQNTVGETTEKQNEEKTLNVDNYQDKDKDIEEQKLDNYELNNLEYDEALKLDKRSCIHIYWSLLRREHLILFTFFVRNDHNFVFVKFTRFVFLICTEMAMNVFFFADATMHKMYLDYGKYNFLLQIPQIVYSTLASQLIEVIICSLSLTDKHYYEIKNLDPEMRKESAEIIIKCVKRKITIFYIFTFLLFAFYWYAIACFCSVYENSQVAFVVDSISSFALGLLYPFLLYSFPAILRIIALKANHNRYACIYKTSDIIPIF